MVAYHIPSVVNSIARHLGHAFSVAPEVAERCNTVLEWHEAASAAFDAYVDSLVEMRKKYSVPGPNAIWRTTDIGGVTYSTATGRLRFEANDDVLTISVMAGPATSGLVEVGELRRRADGLYEFLGNGYDPEISERIALAVDADRTEHGYGQLVVASGFGRGSGRQILWVDVFATGHVSLDWASGGEELVNQKNSRLAELIGIDNRVLGGRIQALDETVASVARKFSVAALINSAEELGVRFVPLSDERDDPERLLRSWVDALDAALSVVEPTPAKDYALDIVRERGFAAVRDVTSLYGALIAVRGASREEQERIVAYHRDHGGDTSAVVYDILTKYGL